MFPMNPSSDTTDSITPKNPELNTGVQFVHLIHFLEIRFCCIIIIIAFIIDLFALFLNLLPTL